jgi:hypothetical protein
VRAGHRVHLRATIRIGELCRALPRERQRDNTGRLLPNAGKQDKSTILKAAGLSTSQAHRAERLAQPQAQAEVEAHIADQAEATP